MSDETVMETALLARRLAGERCTIDTATGESCAWYHGFWQFMRVMGLAKACGGHGEFLAQELRVLARRDGFRRLLISGAVDHTMAVLAVGAYAGEGAAPALSMVDRCETPLALARRYAASAGNAIATCRSNILNFDEPGAYDVIVTNSFLGYFDPVERSRLFARWAALLRPGGKLLFTNRVRPGAGHAPVGFTREQARAFTEAVRVEAQRRSARLPLRADELAALAQAYAARFRSVPVRSSGEVVELLHGAGFHVDRLDTAAASGRPAGEPVAGPTLAEATDYILVAATLA